MKRAALLYLVLGGWWAIGRGTRFAFDVVGDLELQGRFYVPVCALGLVFILRHDPRGASAHRLAAWLGVLAAGPAWIALHLILSEPPFLQDTIFFGPYWAETGLLGTLLAMMSLSWAPPMITVLYWQRWVRLRERRRRHERLVRELAALWVGRH